MTPANRPPLSEELLAQFGRIDIYVFDQILRGTITPEMRILDAGCGAGRNSEYLMRCGADVHGVDSDPVQIEHIRRVASIAAPELPEHNFTVAHLSQLPFPDDYFQAVICSAVLHFAQDEADFVSMTTELWRVLGASGLFFVRLASTIGVEELVTPVNGRWHHLPDGTDRFLVDEAYLMNLSSVLGGELVDPLKTTVVQGMRAMTTWVMRKV